MLTNIHIKNIALIKETDIDLESGLNIMTGETGSGKSIIISAVNIALGDKANKSLIRTGADQALVELTFSNISQQVMDILKKSDIHSEDDILTITRRITPDSSITRANGENIPLSLLKQITAHLVDIHGQHDHQSLLDPSSHIDIIDRFGGDMVSHIKEKLKGKYSDFRSLRKEAQDFNLDEDALRKETELLLHEKQEIEAAALLEGEDDSLEAEYKVLERRKEAAESLLAAYAAVSDEESGAGVKISKALSEVVFAHRIVNPESDAHTAPELTAIKNTITDLDSVIKDLSHDLEKYIERNSFNEERFIQIRERLDQINRLKTRYGNTVADILSYYDHICHRLESYNDYSKTRSQLLSEMSGLRSEINQLAGELSAARKDTASLLEPMIISNLKDLNFLNVNFSIDFKKAEKIGENGFDKVEFMISMNPGEQLKPLSKVASGGELSRIMLAIKSSVADNDDIPTLIFDEIDTGISGKTAQMVAHKLSRLGNSHQIICITHLPQIASMADAYYSIHKETMDGSTISGTEKLNEEAIIKDLARLSGGLDITKANIDNAEDLRAQARLFKDQSSK